MKELIRKNMAWIELKMNEKYIQVGHKLILGTILIHISILMSRAL